MTGRTMRLDKGHVRILTGSEFKLMLRSPQGILALSFIGIYAGWVVTKLIGNADFINSAKPVLISSQNPQIVFFITFQIKNNIHQMFQDFRTGNGASFGDMTH